MLCTRWILVAALTAGCKGANSSDERSAPAESASGSTVLVVRLMHASAVEMAQILNDLERASHECKRAMCALPLPGEVERHEGRPWTPPPAPNPCAEADARTNSIAVTARRPADLPHIFELISRLDADAAEPR